MSKLERIIAIVFCFAIGALLAIESLAQLDNRPVTSSAVVFAVWPPGDGPEYQAQKPQVPLVDAIAVYDGKQFRDLPGFDLKNDENAFDRAVDTFEKRYFRPGISYPYFLHGAAKGNITIREVYGVDCISTTASARLPHPFARGERGIAVSSLDGITGHVDRDTTPSPAERVAFRDAAAALLQTKGVSKAATQGIKIFALHSIYLSPRWPNALAGSIFLKQKDALYSLFVIFTQSDSNLAPALVSYHRATDVEDGTDGAEEYFLSHLDFDGDGIDEVITARFYYESWDYTIYKFQNSGWKAIFNGSGGGC